MIPIFRAKRIDSDEYVIGYLFKDTIGYLRITNGIKDNKHPLKLPFEWIIDTATLAIHFPDMLDSQGNKIFASLQENGKGGDICSVNDYIDSGLEGVAIYQNYGFRIDRKGKAMGISLSSTDIKIIGIQQ